MRVIATAGHVDHGKSALIEALTGIHPDRLKEEQEREMTIDLGFAWLTLPEEEEVGIIDVPGHRDFIENMLAGVGGVDACLFVVAADEGVMPQTREHLAILDILDVQGGVVALTKIDLVDQEWADLVEDDLRTVLAATVLEQSPIVRVSAKTKQGLPELLNQLETLLATRSERPDYNRPRLPVDRVFTISGFGTIVTGTLTDGEFRVGDEIEILPSMIRGRIRGLETHKRKSSIAVPGSRTAINLSGISTDKIRRGDVVSSPGSYLPTQRIDVQFKLLNGVSQELRHNSEVKLFIGSSEVLSRVRLIGSHVLQPGEEGWLQLESKHQFVAMRGDRYIIRRPSPGETLGGGVILDPHPKGRHKRFTQQSLDSFLALSQGSPEDLLYQALINLQPANLESLAAKVHLEIEEVIAAANALIASWKIVNITNPLQSVDQSASPAQSHSIPLVKTDLLLTYELWQRIREKIQGIVTEHHRSHPLRRGISREELRNRVITWRKLSNPAFDVMLTKLISDGVLAESGPIVYQIDHQIIFSAKQESGIEQLLEKFRESPHAPPSRKDCIETVGEEVFSALLELEILIAVSNEIVFRKEDYDRMVDELIEILSVKGTLTAAEVRDHFHTSRKYALALLEYLDSIRITIRDGDVRRLRKQSRNQ